MFADPAFLAAFHREQARRAQPHFVYRCYDADRRLLYVGCTRQPAKRWQSHGDKPWRPQVVAIEWEPHPDFRSGRAAERDAIQTERPAYNVALKSDLDGAA